jgi:HSP20 family molecular chaperone IbpA
MLVPSIFDNNFADNFFNEMFTFPFEGKKSFYTRMQTDVRDLGDRYQLDIELPGYAKEDIQAELKEGYLTIRASHTETIDEGGKSGQYVRKERYTGQCQRSFRVGEHLKQEDIHAKFENGILTVIFPKDDSVKRVDEKQYIMIE